MFFYCLGFICCSCFEFVGDCVERQDVCEKNEANMRCVLCEKLIRCPSSSVGRAQGWVRAPRWVFPFLFFFFSSYLLFVFFVPSTHPVDLLILLHHSPSHIPHHTPNHFILPVYTEYFQTTLRTTPLLPTIICFYTIPFNCFHVFTTNCTLHIHS